MERYYVALEEMTNLVNKTIGEDWNAPRNKIYIAAKLAASESKIRELTDKLYLETEVNKRVREALGTKK